jgi:hypothetical protein
MPFVRTLATGSLAILASLIITGVPSTATAGGPGNNGTVKVAPYGDVDSIPNNTPHVGCTFQLEWYGFDASVVSTVTFEQQSPTTDGTMSVSGSSTVPLDADPGNGAGNDGLDAMAAYTLSFTGGPHPQQGYHVALTINTPESNGSTVKHKVFWVEGCATAAPAPTPTPTEGTTPPVKDNTAPTPPVKDNGTPPVKDNGTPTSTQTTTPATPDATPSAPSATPVETGAVSDHDNVAGDLGIEVLGVEASTHTNGQGASSQAQAGHSSGLTVAPRQQAVPTSINAGTTASAAGVNGLLPVSLAALGALLGLLALAAHRRRA